MKKEQGQAGPLVPVFPLPAQAQPAPAQPAPAPVQPDPARTLAKAIVKAEAKEQLLKGTDPEEVKSWATRAWNAVYTRAQQFVEWLGLKIRAGGSLLFDAGASVVGFGKEIVVRVGTAIWVVGGTAVTFVIGGVRLVIELVREALAGLAWAARILLGGTGERKEAA